MGFSDHFSGVSTAYARFRPRYPKALFAFVASVAPARRLAWDCATGTGQAATALGELFERVVATDASATQIHAAHPHPRVQYSVASAEASGLRAQSVDLITVAQALHWFDLERFYTEASRVLAPGGGIAAWSYGPMRVEKAAVQRALDHLYYDVVGPYWPPERQMVEEGYRSVPFPFEEISAPEFEISTQMSADQLEGYVRTWSATQRFISEQGYDPVAQIDLASIAGASSHGVRWPVAMRVGRTRAHCLHWDGRKGADHPVPELTARIHTRAVGIARRGHPAPAPPEAHPHEAQVTREPNGRDARHAGAPTVRFALRSGGAGGSELRVQRVEPVSARNRHRSRCPADGRGPSSRWGHAAGIGHRGGTDLPQTPPAVDHPIQGHGAVVAAHGDGGVRGPRSQRLRDCLWRRIGAICPAHDPVRRGDSADLVEPTGTVNVVAAECGIPNGVAPALEALARRPGRRAFQAWRVGGRAVLLGLGVGFEARVMDRVSLRTKRTLGFAAIGARGVMEWLRYDFPALRIQGEDCRGRPFDLPATQALATIPRRFAGRHVVAPDAVPEDGCIDLVLFEGGSRLRMAGFWVGVQLPGTAHLRIPSAPCAPAASA